MDLDDALRRLRAVADGVAPATGAPLPREHTCQDLDTVQALYTVLASHSVMQTGRATHPSRKRAGNAFKPWTSENDELLASGFAAGTSQAELAEAQDRSRSAVRARLQHLGLIERPK